MVGNVHKREFSKVTLPEIFQEEDRGLNRCATPIRVLASSTSTHRYKNDLTGISLICDDLTVQLEKSNGDVIPALGIEVDFPFQPNAKGFVIDWRQHLDHIDCYKVKVVFNIAGIVGEYYYGAFDLKQWSWELAKGTVQVFSVIDDYVRTTGINYGDSGFCDTIRFDGTFGEMQPNYQTENITYHNRERKKVRREAIRTYYLNTSFLVNCFTSKIDENHLLAASQIYITEHNPFNHEQYREFPVILSQEESPTFEYPKGGYAVVRAVFLDKKAYYESKYNGKTSGVANVSLELPKGIDCDDGGGGGDTCLDATVTNGGAYVDTVVSGGTLLLPNENITVNGNLLVNKPSVEDYDISILDRYGNPIPFTNNGGVLQNASYPCEYDSDNYVVLVDTDITGAGTTTGSGQFQVWTEGSYNVIATNEDGVTVDNLGVFSGSGNKTFTFSKGGKWVLEFSNGITRFAFNNQFDRAKALEIKQWGTAQWTSFQNDYYGCFNMNVTAVDAPDLSSVTNMSGMFRDCTSLTTLDVSNWNVSSLTNASNMFYNALNFIANIDFTNSYNNTLLTSFMNGVHTINNVILDCSSVSNSGGSSGNLQPFGPFNDSSNANIELHNLSVDIWFNNNRAAANLRAGVTFYNMILTFDHSASAIITLTAIQKNNLLSYLQVNVNPAYTTLQDWLNDIGSNWTIA